MLEDFTTKEQSSVVLNANDIHKEMFSVFGGICLSQLVREKWQNFL
jgi:hypothetical protein